VKVGDVYMAPLDSPDFGYFVTRIWWKPWRYNVWAITIRDDKPRRIATEFNRSAAVGLLKFLEAHNIGD
jgi:hypothetical protein